MTEATLDGEPVVLDAGHVYLLMKRECRVSRNIRASWLFQHLGQVISPSTPQCQDAYEDGIRVLSVTPKDQDVTPDPSKSVLYRILPSTTLTFISESYKLVLVCDLSPSSAFVAINGSHVLIEEYFHALRHTVKALLCPFSAPGSEEVVPCCLHITVLAHIPLVHCSANHVVVQGYELTKDNVASFLQLVRKELERVETLAAKDFSKIVQESWLEDHEDLASLTGGIFTDIVEQPEPPDPNTYLMSPDITFVNMLRYGILGLQLLPGNSTAGIVLLTDGYLGLPDTSLFESLMTQLRNNTISCSFIKVGGATNYKAGFGRIANTELMQFIATATFGAYFTQLPEEDHSCAMNILQRALLTWTFQRGLEGFKIDNFSHQAYEEATGTMAHSHSRLKAGDSRMWQTPLMRRKHQEKSLSTSIFNVIALRLREGYTIKEISINKAGNQIDVQMVLPWREAVRIAYTASSAWPVTATKKTTHVDITIEGSYEFLRDVTTTSKQGPIKSPYRQALIKRYWQTLQGVSETDRLLLHLQSFSSTPVYYSIPESIKSGIPLYYMPPNSVHPDITMQLQHNLKFRNLGEVVAVVVRDQAFSSFASFWKPVFMLDTTVWQRWMHYHRICALLEHDTPLGKHLHMPNSSGRFHGVTCRQALTSLCFMLRSWSTFVLMESHSYIKFIFDDPDQPPVSFLLIRLVCKPPPCLVLRLAFLGGTSSSMRTQIVNDLRERIVKLNFPHRSSQKDEAGKKPAKRVHSGDKDIGTARDWKPPLQRLRSEILCCVQLHKPVEKILIRYERMPRDFFCMDGGDRPDIDKPTANRLAYDTFTTLSKYMLHQRWVWDVQRGATISSQAIGRVISTLTRLRLQEGFHFGHASHGIVTMVLELNMQTTQPAAVEPVAEAASEQDGEPETPPTGGATCLVQYVVFPPHTKLVNEGFSEEEDEGIEQPESDRELQVITECWIEPQHGRVTDTAPEQDRYRGKTGAEIPHTLFECDEKCISTMVTFEHLNMMCQCASIPSPVPTSDQLVGAMLDPRMLEATGRPEIEMEGSVQQVPFPFNIMQLLEMCQQVEMLFYSYVQDIEEELDKLEHPDSAAAMQTPNSILFQHMEDKIRKLHDRELHLTDAECSHFLTLVQARERTIDSQPLPFDPNCCGVELNRQISNNSHVSGFSVHSGMTTQSELPSGSVSQRSSMSHVPMRLNSEDSVAYLLAIEREAQSKDTSADRTSDVFSQRSSQRTPKGAADDKVSLAPLIQGAPVPQQQSLIPKWLCFAKSVASNQILVTMMPASLKDFCHLQGIHAQPQPTQPADPKASAAPSLESSASGAKAWKSDMDSPQADPYLPEHKRRGLLTKHASLEKDREGSSEGAEPATASTNLAEAASNEMGGTDRPGTDAETQKGQGHDGDLMMDTRQARPIPVYMYNCPHNVLVAQLEDRWTYTRPPDLFLDYRFENESEETRKRTSESSGQEEVKAEETSNAKPGEPEKEEATEQELEKQNRDRTTSNNSKVSGSDGETTHGTEGRKRRIYKDSTSSENAFGDQTDARDHCEAIVEGFQLAFATGVFTSLQNNLNIHKQDVDIVINHICEELLPLEIDITRFLQSSCGHLHNFLERYNQEQTTKEDILRTFPSSREIDPEDPLASSTDLSALATSSPITQTAPSALLFPLASLAADRKCERTPGVHRVIHKKCLNIIKVWFKPIPSNPEFFIFCPSEGTTLEQDNVEDEARKVETGTDEKAEGEADNGEVFLSDVKKLEPEKESSRNCAKTPRTPLPTVESDTDTIASFLEHESDSIKLEGLEEVNPLFTHLVCTVRTTSGRHMRSIPVKFLPTCLGKLRSCLEGLGPEINLNDLHVTLDVICLTLPSDDPQPPAATKPSYDRMMSHSSQLSCGGLSFGGQSISSIDDLKSPVATCSITGDISDTITNPLSQLPSVQQEAIRECVQQVEWLLWDEIVSAMLLIQPVREDTLQLVVKYVRDAPSKVSCLAERVPLQFVYGPDQSLTNFIQEVEQMNDSYYRWNKVGPFYYMYVDYVHAHELERACELERARAHSLGLHEVDALITAQALSSALQDLQQQERIDMTGLDLGSPESLQASKQPSLAKLDLSCGMSPMEDRQASPKVESQQADHVTPKEDSISGTVVTEETDVTSPKQHPDPTLEEKSSSYAIKHDSEDAQKSGPEMDKEASEEGKEHLVADTGQAASAEDKMLLQQQPESAAVDAADDTELGETTTAPHTINEESQVSIEPEEESLTIGTPSSETLTDQHDWSHSMGTPSTVTLTEECEDDIQNEQEKGPPSSRDAAETAEPQNADAVTKQQDIPDERRPNPADASVCVAEVTTPTEITESEKAVHKESDMPPGGRQTPASSLRRPDTLVHREDITISVTRPSPVKEVPRQSRDDPLYQADESESGSEGEQPEGATREKTSSGPRPDKEAVKAKRRRFRRLKSEQSSVDSEVICILKSEQGTTTELAGSSVVKPADKTMKQEEKSVPSPSTSSLTPSQPSEPIRRVVSSGSFEKYKMGQGSHVGMGWGTSLPQTPTWSGRTTPQKYAGRSRHQSGLMTPLSLVETVSSRGGSFGEDGGYDGDFESDLDPERDTVSLNESTIPTRKMPLFWLIMIIQPDIVEVLFHTRDLGEDMDEDMFIGQKKVFENVIKTIEAKCKVVNQRLLLENLYETRMCDKLLVPEADEDVRWTAQELGVPRKRMEESDESDGDNQSGQYLAASLQFVPGYFACDCVKKVHFPLQPRLKGTQSGRGGSAMSRGVQALRSVLNAFSVNNRQNMFVIKENIMSDASKNAVFYLRLEECVCEVRTPSGTVSDASKKGEEENQLSASRSSSMWSLPVTKRVLEMDEESTGVVSPRRLSVADLSAEEMKASTPIKGGRRAEESIVLSFHGICDVGPETSEDLIKMLQKRLDDAVLDIITIMLVRNPMCKLTPEDVSFIQRPGPPQSVLCLTIPSAAMLQQFSLGFYLKQHLLQWCHTPKFTEGLGDGVFQDYSAPQGPVAIPESDVFLYNRPQQTGGKGLAVIHLSFVDGKGTPVQLMSSHRPSPHEYKEKFDASMFACMVSVNEFKVDPTSKFPGQTAVVQFQIWERGDVDMKNVVERLTAAMKHAACDIITEYRLLTAPLCEVPEHYTKGIDSPLHSAPPSPIPVTLQDPRSLSFSAPLVKKQMSDSGQVRTPKEKSSFLRDVSELLKAKVSGASTKENQKPEESESLPHVPQSLEQQQEAELRMKMQKYEMGERGVLLPLYSSTMQDWFQFCYKEGVASVNHFRCKLISRFAVDYMLSEFQTMVATVASDITIKSFKHAQPTVGEAVFLPYTAARTPTPSGDRPLEEMSSSQAASSSPGRKASYVLVGRNIQQWQSCVSRLEPEEEGTDTPLPVTKYSKNFQKFAPLEPHAFMEGSMNLGTSSLPDLGVSSETAYVPRQRLLLLNVQDKEFCVYLYNWATDAANNLERTFTRLIEWHNARSHLLNSIISQKMGQFQHSRFRDAAFQAGSAQDSLYPNSISDLENIVKFTTPPLKDLQIRPRTGSFARPSQSGTAYSGSAYGLPGIDTLYRNRKPAQPMHTSGKYAGMRDPVHRHGAQFIELMKKEQTESRKRKKLESMYFKWQQKMGPAPPNITEDDLDLLKHSARLIHTVASPILFSPVWRAHLMQRDKPKKAEPQPAQDTKPRSRHGSGASVKSRKSDDIKRKPSCDVISTRKELPEEPWHMELRLSFLNQYMLYLQSVLSFVQVQVRQTSPKRKLTKDAREAAEQSSRCTAYLQKTLPGGIMLIELGFKQVHFCVKVYVLECSCLPMGHTVNNFLAMIFTDECDRLKDLTHVHSFSHDFHLRMVQSYISGSASTPFKSGYHLTSFLRDFLKHYPVAPGFSRNYITHDVASFLDVGCSSYQLFDYMLNHEKMYGMRALRMMPLPDADSDQEPDYALVSRLTETQCEERGLDREQYNIGMVASPDYTADNLDDKVLRIAYYVVATTRRQTEQHPNPKLERRLGILQATSISKAIPARKVHRVQQLSSTPTGYEIGSYEYMETESPASSTCSKTGKSYSAESINYLGYSNMHQIQVYSQMEQETRKAREKIEDIVDCTMSLCQRDVLWQRMLVHSQPPDTRRRHKSGYEDSKELLNTRLSFREFQDLLDIVTRVPLADIDPSLMPLHNMHLSWYQGLCRVLRARFNETQHRYFASQDGHIEYVVVPNANYLDMFMMLGVDMIGCKAELCAVFREQQVDEIHTPSKPNLPAMAVQQHMEQFINTVAFHMWTGLAASQ